MGVCVKKRAAFALLAAIALAGCSKSAPPPISSGERYAEGAASDDIYKLGAGDKIRVIVYNEPQLSGDFSVSSDGEISLPLIGNVQVGGKPIERVTQEVQARLSDGYLRDPRVNMEVATYRPFFILGEVRSPGQYPYLSGLTALNAIATAQGYTPRARKSTVRIRRFGDQYEQEFVLTPNLRIYPGDTIRLTERFF
jgi:polysaccharide export outer membrane protein